METSLDKLRLVSVAGAEQLRARYAERFVGDLEGELHAWLHVAARREATLGKIQGEIEWRPVLVTMASPANEVAREALVLIVKRGRRHMSFVDDVLASGHFSSRTLAAELMLWLGDEEDVLLGPVERRVEGERDGTALLLLCATLAATVRQAYVQLGVLTTRLRDAANRDTGNQGAVSNDGRLGALARDFRVKAAEKEFHENVFQELAGWVSRATAFEQLRSGRVCAERLASLLPMVEGNAGSGVLRGFADGGLGRLFARHRVTIERSLTPRS